MTISVFIRYQIDPFQREAFRAYAQEWLRIIPRCGGDLRGYYLKADPEGQENFERARSQRLILREERTFLENVERP